MMTAEKLASIKAMLAQWQVTGSASTSRTRFDRIQRFAAALVVIEDLIAEVERVRSAGQAAIPRKAVLDARGNVLLPPPISHQLADERREQYDADRLEALLSIEDSSGADLLGWRTFCLRWGLAPPPGGWGDQAVILLVIHSLRLTIDGIPRSYQISSVNYLQERGHKLPPGFNPASLT